MNDIGTAPDAQPPDPDRFPRCLFELTRRLNLLAIKLKDNVTGVEADAAGNRVGFGFEHDDAFGFGNGKLLGHGGRQVRHPGAAERVLPVSSRTSRDGVSGATIKGIVSVRLVPPLKTSTLMVPDVPFVMKRY